MLTATATEVQNNFGKYLGLAQTDGEVIIMKNGKEVARLVSRDKNISFLTDALTGVLKGDYDDKREREDRIEKRENTD